MDEDKRIVIENLTTRYPGTEQPQLRQINAEVHTGQVVGIIGLRLRATGTCLASECPTIGPFIMP